MSDDDHDGGLEAERDMKVEALLMGKWLKGRVLRVGRDGEVDLELDDGTELENVDESKLRRPREPSGKLSSRKRASSWECLEALAVDAHARRGGGGRRPLLRGDVERERDELRRLEKLLGKEHARALRGAFDKADSMREGELDVDDCLAAFSLLHRVAVRSDVLDWLRKRGRRSRSRRTLDFLEFAKCFAGIFHDPTAGPDPASRTAGGRAPGDGPALFADEAAIAAEWARTLGRKQLLKLEDAFKRRCAPHTAARGGAASLGKARLGLPVDDLRSVFRDVGFDIAPSRLQLVLKDSGLKRDDFLSFVEFVSAYHALFVASQRGRAPTDATASALDNVRPPARAVDGADGPLRPLAEIASVVFAEEKWEGTPLQHGSLVRRLCVGRSVRIGELVRHVRDAFEALDADRLGQLPASRAETILHKCKLDTKKHHALRDAVLRAFQRPADDHDDRSDREEAKGDAGSDGDYDDDASRRQKKSKKYAPFTLAEFFSIAGHLVEAAGETEATVASAFARLRLTSTPAEVRAAGELAARYVANAVEFPASTQYWRVATDNAAFASRIGRLRGGKELMAAIGFGQRVVDATSSSGSKKREWLAIKGTVADARHRPLDRLPGDTVMLLKARLQEIEVSLATHLGAPSVHAALREMREHKCRPGDLKAAADLAHKLVTNVLKNPGDPRVYRVRAENGVLAKAVLRHTGGAALLRSVGFGPDATKAFFVLELRGQADLPKASQRRDFSFPKLDGETEAFLYRALADLEDALRSLEKDVDELEAKGTKGAGRKVVGKDRAGKIVKTSGVSELESMLRRGTHVQQAQLQMARRAFAAYDVDGDGAVTRSDLKTVFTKLGKPSDGEALDRWIAKHDADRDGTVSLSDFLNALAPMFALSVSKKKAAKEAADFGVAAAVGTLRVSCTLREAANVCAHVLRTLKRIIDAPSDGNHWRVKLSDAAFERAVGRHAGGVSLMVACGFQLEENGAVLALRSRGGEKWASVPADVLEELRLVRAELQGRATALDHPTVSDVRAVTAGIHGLGGDVNTWVTIVSICIKYLRNVLEHPTADKYRRLSTSNRVFQEKILAVPGGLKLFVALGFREADGGLFVLPKDAPLPELEARALELEAALPYLKERAALDAAAAAGRKVDKRPKSATTTAVPAATKERPKSAAPSFANAARSTMPPRSSTARAHRQREAAVAEKKRALEAKKLRDAEVAKAKAEHEAVKAKKLADRLASQLHELKTAKKTVAPRRAYEEEPAQKPMKFSGARPSKSSRLDPRKEHDKTFLRPEYAPAHAPQQGPVVDGQLRPEGVTDVKTSLTEPAKAGATVLHVASNAGWKVGWKARVGHVGGLQEEKFVSRLGSIHLSGPLQYNHGVGAPVVMFRATAKERDTFRRAAAILFVHNDVLKPAIDRACALGERLLASREAQARFDARAVPRSTVLAHAVFARDGAGLAGSVAPLGSLLLREARGDDEALVSFGDGFTLSDLRRLFDRVDKDRTGFLTPAMVAAATQADADVAALFGDLALEAHRDLDFVDDVLPRFYRRDARDVARVPLRAATSRAEGAWAWRLADSARADLGLAFRCHQTDDGYLSADALPAVFRDLEGALGSGEAHAMACARDDYGALLTFADLVDLRAKHCGDLGVPVDHEGRYLGGGINGWRRHVLWTLRPLWVGAVAEASRAAGRSLDGAPGPKFVEKLRQAADVRPFLNLEVRRDANLRDVFADVATSSFDPTHDCFLTWRHVEALVFGDVAAPGKARRAPPPAELFRAGPAPVVASLAGAPTFRGPAAEEASADLALVREAPPRRPRVLEVVVDDALHVVFSLTDDGVLDSWDAVSKMRNGSTPLLVVTPERTPRYEEGDGADDGDDAAPLPKKLARRVLALEPASQILSFHAGARTLCVNTTAGDGCLRFHEVATFGRTARVRLELPPMRDFRLGFFDDPEACHLPNPEWSSVGALARYEFVAEDGVLVGSVHGDAALRAFDARSGLLCQIMPGHAAAVSCLCVLPALRLCATGSVDATLRVWDRPRRFGGARGAPPGPDFVRKAREILGAAAQAVGLEPGWRIGTITSIFEASEITGEGDLVEVEFDDDGSLELWDPLKVHEAPSENNASTYARAKVAKHARVAVYHDRRRASVAKLFGSLDARGAGAIAADAFADAFAELRNAVIDFGDDTDDKGYAYVDPRAVALALDVDGDGFVTASAVENFVAGTRRGVVSARRRLRGHEGAVTALAFLPHASLLASASADGTLRLWDPRDASLGLVSATFLPHVCGSPGYYRPLADEWTRRNPQRAALHLAGVASPEAGSPFADKRAKFSATKLLAVSLASKYARSRVAVPDVAAKRAAELDERFARDDGPHRARGLLYLLDDGVVLAAPCDRFDARNALLRVEDAALFEVGADPALTAAFHARERILRVAYVASSVHPNVKTIADAMAASSGDFHLLTKPRGGDVDTLRKLAVDLVLFCRCGEDPKEDCRHVVEDARRRDRGPLGAARAFLDGGAPGGAQAVETLAAEVAATAPDGKTRRSVVCFALARCALGSRRDRAHVADDSDKDRDALAAHATLNAWRSSLHAFRVALVDQRRGVEASRAAEVAVEQRVADATRDVVLRTGAPPRRHALRGAFDDAVLLRATHADARAKRRFYCGVAFRNLATREGRSRLQLDRLAAEVRELGALEDDLGLDALAPSTLLGLREFLEVVDRRARTRAAAPSAFLLRRPVAQAPRDLPMDEDVDGAGFEDAVLAGDLQAGARDACATIAARVDALQRDGDAGWLERWARCGEAAAWCDHVRAARLEALAASSPALVRVDRALNARARPALEPRLPRDETAPFEAWRASDRRYRVTDCDYRRPSCGADDGVCYFGEVSSTSGDAERRAATLLELTSDLSGEQQHATQRLVSSEDLASCPGILRGLVASFDEATRPARWLAFDRFEGSTSLRHLLDTRGGLGLDLGHVARFWIGQVVEAVAHCHAFGVLVRTLGSERVLVAAGGGAVKVVLAAPGQLDARGYLDGGRPLTLSPTSPQTPPEALVVETRTGASSDADVDATAAERRASDAPRPRSAKTWRCSDEASTAKWDTWLVGVLMAEVVSGSRPAAFFDEFRKFLRRRDAGLDARTRDVAGGSLRRAAESFHYCPFYAEREAAAGDDDDARRRDLGGGGAALAADGTLPDASFKAKGYLRAMRDGELGAIWRAGDASPSADANDIVAALRNDVSLAVADRSFRPGYDASVAREDLASEILAALEAEAPHADAPVAAEALEAVLRDGFGFSLREGEAKVLADATGGDRRAIFAALAEGGGSRRLTGPASCVAACLRVDPRDRPDARDLDRGRFFRLEEREVRRAADDAELYVMGKAEPRRWFRVHVLEPLEALEAALDDGRVTVPHLSRFADAVDGVADVARGTASVAPRSGDAPADAARRRRVNAGVCALMVDDAAVLDRCLDAALRVQDLDLARLVPRKHYCPGDRAHSLGERVICRVGECLRDVLVLLHDPEAPVADHMEAVVRVAAKLLTADAGLPRGAVDDDVGEAFTAVAPAHLATIVNAARALSRPGGGSSVKRGATKAFAALFRLEPTQDDAARQLAAMDVVDQLLPLAGDEHVAEVRVAALQCCLNATTCGFDELRAAEGTPEYADALRGPRVALARRFSEAPWVAALARTIRSPSATPAELDVAFEALGVLAAQGDVGQRHFGAGGALPALVFVLNRGGNTTSDRRQDTCEAGGTTHRLLDPFGVPGGSRADLARRVLGLILRGDGAFKRVLEKAHPYLCGPGGGLF